MSHDSTGPGALTTTGGAEGLDQQEGSCEHYPSNYPFTTMMVMNNKQMSHFVVRSDGVTAKSSSRQPREIHVA